MSGRTFHLSQVRFAYTGRNIVPRNHKMELDGKGDAREERRTLKSGDTTRSKEDDHCGLSYHAAVKSSMRAMHHIANPCAQAISESAPQWYLLCKPSSGQHLPTVIGYALPKPTEVSQIGALHKKRNSTGRLRKSALSLPPSRCQ